MGTNASQPVRRRSTVARWGLAALLLVAGLVALGMALLVFPYPAFPHRGRFGPVTVSSDRPLPADIGAVVERAQDRILPMEPGAPAAPYQVFLCRRERTYGFFALLARMPSGSQAFSLSLPRHVFLNERFITRMSHPVPGLSHWRFEGDLAASIAHEVAHFRMNRELGAGGRAPLPFWKSEGYADFLTQRTAIRADSTYDLGDRIGRWLDDDAWDGASRQRRLLGWQLLVEYLVGVRGLGLAQLADASVSESATRQAMIDWYRTDPARASSATE